MNKLLESLGINETYTKPIKKAKVYNRVRDNIPLMKHYNYMADLLALPKTSKGFKYLLVVVDLATDNFDIEPMKNKEALTTLKALQAMFKRPYIKKPYSSIRTDAGTEFKEEFNKWLYKNSILHISTLPDRHSQLSNVERLNRTLGRLFNGYMNKKEEETDEQYNEWTDIIDEVRTKLNKIRMKKILNDPVKEKYNIPDFEREPKYKVGDVVLRLLDYPEDALGNRQPTAQFREGDYRWSRVPKKIVQVLYYTGKVPYRYMLEGFKNVSFAEHQLIPVPENEKETKYKVKQIIGKKKIKGKEHYLIWWKGYLKKDATWEPKDKLIEDGLKKIIDNYKK